MDNEIYKKLAEVQKKLVAPKGQFNSFGQYNFRSCEDILEGLKLVLPCNYSVTINDKMIEVGGRVYVEATASFNNGDGNCVTATASAREQEKRKGMDESQVTGATSSYARKYALNALFAIDDTKDADSGEGGEGGKEEFISTDQQTAVSDLVKEVKADIVGFLKYFKIEKFEDLPVNKYDLAIKLLNSKVG